MSRQITWAVFLICLMSNAALAQRLTNIHFSFDPPSILNLNDAADFSKDTSQLEITDVKFYISHIQFLKKGKIVFEEMVSFHLIDASQEKSCQIAINIPDTTTFDELSFYLGIDSLTNIIGVMGGELDPTKGMYWAWQSGYINVKIEGTSPLCKTRNNEFQFHLGGYQSPNISMQTLSFPVNDTKNIHLSLDLLKILTQIDLSKTNHIMSPSEAAVRLSKIVSGAIVMLKK